MSSPRRILIIGSTPLALFLATHWNENGHSVTMLDRKGADFSSVPDSLAATCIVGEPLDRSLLRRARIEETEVVVGATSNDDLNLSTAIACLRAFHVEHAVAVVHDPRKANMFGDFGVHVVCPTFLAAASIFRAVGNGTGTAAEPGPHTKNDQDAG